MRLMDVDNYCENICLCNRDQCDKEKCSVFLAPAVDAVEVVRCAKCIHAREMDEYEKQLYLDECVGCTCLSTSYHSIIMQPTDFCSYGERKKDGE